MFLIISQSQIKTIRNSYDSSELQLSDWLAPCYEGCLKIVISFSEWCYSLSPPIFEAHLGPKFLALVTTELNQPIQTQSAELLNNFKFDELCQIDETIEKCWIKLPPSWKLSEDLHKDIKKGLDQVYSDFIMNFQNYLNQLLNPTQKTIPKSSTTDNFNKTPKQPPYSPIRSSSMFETSLIAPISTTYFDKKLSEYSKNC